MTNVVFSVVNPVAGLLERTYITSRYTSGTSLTVKNTEGWADGDILVAGRPGHEGTDADSVASTTGASTITLDNGLDRSKAIDTPLYLSQWNQISFERKTSGGSYAAITGSPFDIEWDESDGKTKIVIPTFVTSDTLRWRFYNSATTTYSSYSDEVAGTGIARDEAATPLNMILSTPVGKKYQDQISLLLGFFNDLHDEIEEDMPMAWFIENDSSTDLVEDGVYEYPLPTDFIAMKSLLYRDFQDQEYPLTWINEIEMRNLKTDTTQPDDDTVRFWTTYPPDSNSPVGYIVVHPTPATNGSGDDGKLTFVYSKSLADIDSPGDTLPIPQPRIYFEYAMYRIFYDLEENDERSTSYERRYITSKVRLRQRLSRQRGQAELFKFKGQDYYSRLFGDITHGNIDTIRENYF